MNTEIERKYLVEGEYKHLATSHTHIQQGYFATEPGRTVRIRIRNDKAYLTIKGPSADGGLSRYEFETEIPLDDARHMLTLCMPGRVDKVRWLIPYGTHTIEVDEFLGDNAGLVLAEVELTHPDDPFSPPDFMVQEVTGISRYYNKYLIRHPYNTWNK